MTTNKFSGFLIAIVFFTLLSGCVLVNQPISSPVPETATVGLLPTITMPLSSPTQIPATPLTSTPVSTLTIDEAYNRIYKLLNYNSDCRLPCWMGIIPGQSTLSDVQEQLTMFSGIADWLFIKTAAGEWSSGALMIPYPNDNMVIEVSPYYLTSVNDNKVSVIHFRTRAYQLNEYNGDVYGYPVYNEYLKPYTLAEVLSSYGPPSQIFIDAALGSQALPVTPGFGDYFKIHLWYPEQGIFMEYKISLEGSGDNYRFCPTNALILGVLTPPGLAAANYKEILLEFGDEYTNFFPPSEFTKTPEEAFSMTIEEFYQLFRSPTNQCLETPKSIWWPK